MADDRTRRALQRHVILRNVLPGAAGALVGILPMLTLGYAPTRVFAETLGLFEVILPSAASAIASSAWGVWLAAPLLTGLLASWLAERKSLEPVFAWLLPAPPSFTRSDIEAERAAMVDLLEGEAVPMLGRRVELGRLIRFLNSDAPFSWQSVSGPSGIGKTRLGAEWLLRARDAGWDVGIADPSDVAQLLSWNPRRRTALVFDDLERNWSGRLGEILERLSRVATASRRVRVVLLDERVPYVDSSIGRTDAVITATQYSETLTLPQLPRSQLERLRAEVGVSKYDLDKLESNSAGRPRAALILLRAEEPMSLARASRRWAKRLMPELTDDTRPIPPSLAVPLVLAGIAGPIATDVARAICGPIDAGALRRFFPERSRRELESALPALQPADLGDEIALSLLARVDSGLRAKLVETSVSVAPERLMQRMREMWGRGTSMLLAAAEGDDADRHATLRELQATIDALRRGEVEKQLQQLEAVTEQSCNAGADPSEASAWLEITMKAIAERPFDDRVCLLTAQILGNILWYRHQRGDAGWRSALEPLLAITGSKRFDENLDMLMARVIGILNALAIVAGGGSRQELDALASLSRQGIGELARHRVGLSRPIIVEDFLGKHCVSVVLFYSRRDTLDPDRVRRAQAEFREQALRCAPSNVALLEYEATIARYAARAFSLVPWGLAALKTQLTRLEQLASDYPHSSHIATKYRGAFVEWGRFHSTHVKSLPEVEVAWRQIWDLGTDGARSPDVDLLNDRIAVLCSLTKILSDGSDPAPLDGTLDIIDGLDPGQLVDRGARADYVAAINNGMYFYSRFKDEQAMERWAQRLEAVPTLWSCDNVEVARMFARAAANGASCYRSRLHLRHAHWRGHLAKLAREWPNDVLVQEKAKFEGVSILDQRP